MAVQLRQLKAEIIPDLSKLSAGLADANAQLEKFAKAPRQAPSLPPPDPKIADALEAISRTAAKARGDVEGTAQALGASGTSASRSERDLLQYAQAVARLQQASGDATGAQNTLRQALDAVEGQTRQSIAAATQLERVQSNVGGLKQSFDGLTQSLGSLGIAFGAQQILQFGVDAIQSANSLEKTEATTRALSGSTERYNEVLAIAEDGQRKYGGSLEESLKGLGALVNLSNRTGVELTNLDNIARRLAVVDPAQGIEGANFALKEFLSGDNAAAAKSLIERFELSPSLKAIASSGADATTKIAALNAELNNLGISQDVLTNSTETSAATYDRLGASLDNAKVKVGAFLSEALEPAARGLDRLINADFGNLAASFQQATANNPYLQSLPAVQALNLALGKLSENQKAATTDAIAPAKDYADAVDRISKAEEQHAKATALTAEETDKLQAKLQQVAEKGQEAAQRLADAQTTYAQQSAERRTSLEQSVADQQQATAQRLADLDSSYLAERTDRAKQNADQRADIERAAIEKIAGIQARLNDVPTNLNETLIDKQRDTYDRQADIQQRASDRQTDTITEYNQRAQELQDQLNAAIDAKQQEAAQKALDKLTLNFTQKQERDARDEAQAIEKLQRDAARDEERAMAKAAKEQETLQAQIQAEVTATSERLQKQDAQDAAELAKIDARFVKERASIQLANDAKLADMQASYDKEEATRATAYAKQEAQLRETLGKQLQDYTEQQLKLSLITAEEAARRQQVLASQYGVTDPAQAAGSFNELANGIGRAPTAGSPAAAYSAYASQQQTQIFNLNIAPGDPQAQVLAIRQELNRIALQNGSSGIGGT